MTEFKVTEIRKDSARIEFDGEGNRIPTYDSPYGASRVFLKFVGENILDDLRNRTSRPYKVLKPLVLKELENQGINVEKLRWSQNAGCTMCPCSPGFIIDGERGTDYWARVTAA